MAGGDDCCCCGGGGGGATESGVSVPVTEPPEGVTCPSCAILRRWTESGVARPEGVVEVTDEMPAFISSSVREAESSMATPSSSSSSSSCSSSPSSICPHLAVGTPTSSSSTSASAVPNTSPYSGRPNSSTGGLPQPPGWYPYDAPSGMGAFRPGIFRLGYAGGGPYRCILTSHGGGPPSGICSALASSSESTPGRFSRSDTSNSLPS
mmetsp:Transcript_65768/g.180356  ORF Transcript_65768/g.180356 Transcript_65768/m.180356 type:complete len:208 (+) Transcript_65768:64-687(+)